VFLSPGWGARDACSRAGQEPIDSGPTLLVGLAAVREWRTVAGRAALCGAGRAGSRLPRISPRRAGRCEMSALVTTRSDGMSRLPIASTFSVPETQKLHFPTGRPVAASELEPPEKAAMQVEPPETWQSQRCEAPDAGREERGHDDGGFRHGRSKG
jgi:hypothetical protein